LDKITGGFKSIIGNEGLGWDGAPLFLAASVLFIGFFTLYFATPVNTDSHRRKRLLTWFFAQFLFFSALIVTLQGPFAFLFGLDQMDDRLSSSQVLPPCFNLL
jgi:hypothetical protein